jgi:GNAT superfamily N-acetyltransferase
MSRTASRSVTIRPYLDRDEAVVLDLLTASLGPGPVGLRTPELFRWKHLENPFGRSVMLVAEDEDRVIGLRAFMRWRFTGEEGQVEAVRAVDTATHPDHQGRGVFSQLTRSALAQLPGEGVDLVFNTPNAKSGPGYLKLGWREVGRIGVAAKVGRILRTRSDEPPPIDAMSARQVLADARLPDLLAHAEVDGSRLETRRDLAFLEWRYGAGPLDYRAVLHEVSGDLRGVAFVRVRARGRWWQTSVPDVVVESGDRSAARRLLRSASACAPTDLAVTRLPSGSTASQAAAGQGFVRLPGGIRFVVNAVRDDVVPDPTALRSWALRLGDVEVF